MNYSSTLSPERKKAIRKRKLQAAKVRTHLIQKLGGIAEYRDYRNQQVLDFALRDAAAGRLVNLGLVEKQVSFPYRADSDFAHEPLEIT